MTKIVDSPRYHVWSDALHACALAHQARNRWDRGAYVRWTILMAWTALEMACGDALQSGALGSRFKERIDEALAHASLAPINWGEGLWQGVLRLQTKRNRFMHRNATQEELLLDPHEATEAIHLAREGIRDIYRHAKKEAPIWIDDNEDSGWDYGRPVAHTTATKGGANPKSSDTIRIAYVYKDHEYVQEILPPTTDPEQAAKALVDRMRIPIERIRAYRGKELILDLEVRMRG